MNKWINNAFFMCIGATIGTILFLCVESATKEVVKLPPKVTTIGKQEMHPGMEVGTITGNFEGMLIDAYNTPKGDCADIAYVKDGEIRIYRGAPLFILRPQADIDERVNKLKVLEQRLLDMTR